MTKSNSSIIEGLNNRLKRLTEENSKMMDELMDFESAEEEDSDYIKELEEQVGVVDTVIALLKEFKNDTGELLTDMRYDIINDGYNSVEESAYKAGYKEALNRISRELL